MILRTPRFQAALLGCGLAVASCLVTPTSHSEVPRQPTFELPDTLGPWELLEQGTLQESELRILQASDHWRRVYQCRDTKEIVDVTLIAGASGPVASHQPEICYSRNEFSSPSDARLWTVPERSDTFRFHTFEPRQFERPALTIAYAWHDGVRWRVPRVPRLQLAGHAVLQRLQRTMRHPSGMARDAQAAMRQFIQLAVDAADARQSRHAPFPTPARTVSLTGKQAVSNQAEYGE